ncbi:DUF6785 family protein [Salidesulfovibrio brasiliensis]|uniref:DUF6785 family protein n=1 Tax=Salidesulfovibrio brasiliensis TaxID=221711 RepID=UPI0006D10087|nr:DUF6785 family protein [Salidesulfovibrio brasiliensis]
MSRTIRLRAIVTGLLIGLLLSVITPYNSAVLGNTPIGSGSFPLAPFFIAAWLFVICAVQARLTGREPWLRGSEILTVWAMSALFAAISYGGLAETFFLNVTAPERFAAEGYRWAETLRPILPESWYPSDAGTVKLLYNGLPDARDLGLSGIVASIPWAGWLPVLAVWSVFILASYFVMLCLMRLFGRQWVVNERVTFPLLRTPQLMGKALDEGGCQGFWSNRYLLWGLGFAICLHLFNGMAKYYPSVPEFPTLILAGKYFPKFGLFSGFHKLKMAIVPAFIGFAFLTTRQISFSLWGFYILAGLLFGLLYVMGWQLPEAALGTTFGPDLARPEAAQTIGAYGIFFIFLVWLARHHLKEVWICSIRPVCKPFLEQHEASGALPDEWTPPIWPLWGALGGGVFLAFWCWYFGLPPLAAILLPGAFFMVMLVSARAVCQGGLPFYTLTAAPSDGLTGLFGSGFLGSAGIAATAVMQKVLFLDVKDSVMPTLFHSSKIGEQSVRRRMVPLAVGLSLALAVIAGFAVMLVLCHKYGLRELKLDWATQTVIANYQNAQRLVDVPTGPNQWMIFFSGVGAVVMGLLIFCYYRFPWWPLHPIGYLVCYSATLKILWFSIFLGWACNHLCLHYGGTALYNRLRFLFIGMILGDFLSGGFFAALGAWTGTVYNVFPF